jgi:cytidylate kinase
MWQKISHPDLLIFLDASFPVSTGRRQLTWQKGDHEEQLRRLAHARQHANLLIDTDDLTPEQVLEIALDYLREQSLV